MPSHRVHEMVGQLICNFSSGAIDSLIDNTHQHDMGRINCKVLLEQVTKVYEDHGGGGICYYILHHYLDKIESVIRGRVDRLFLNLKYGKTIEERLKHLSSEVRKGLENEVSSLSIISEHWFEYILSRDVVEGDFLKRYYIRNELLKRGYSESAARRKAENIIKILAEMSKNCSDYDSLMKLRSVGNLAMYVRGCLIRNLEKVLCIMFNVDRKKWLKYWGEKYYNHLINDVLCCENCLRDLENPRQCIPNNVFLLLNLSFGVGSLR